MTPSPLRHDGRFPAQLRPTSFTADIAPHSTGSVLVATGNTRVICSAMIEEGVPRWMKEQSVTGGWLTAEYSMLPYSTLTRKPRDIMKGRMDGRGTEIQRLIGRALRAVVDLEALGPRTLCVDCDVLQADGGTRTASITGATVAVLLAGQKLVTEGKLPGLPMKKLAAAVSVGVCGGVPLLDLDYIEDKDAAVDMNLVMTNDLEFIELQGSGEESVFSSNDLTAMLDLGRIGITQLIIAQKEFLASRGVEV